MADNAVISDSALYRKISKQQSDMSDMVGKYREWKAANKNLQEARLMLAETDPELRTMAQDEVARLEPLLTQYEEELKVLMLPKDPQRREERRPRNPRRHGRRRGYAVRGRNLPHVWPLRRIARLEGRSNVRERFGRGRTEGSHRPDQRQPRLQPAEVRERRASRPARSANRAAGARAHVRHHRGRAAGSRRRRDQARSQGRSHRHVLLLGSGRAERQHDVFRGAADAPAHRRSRVLPGREIADQESRESGARPPLAPV